MSTKTLPPLRDVIARYDLMARKSLGQHFLCDLNLTRCIAEQAGDLSGSIVLEIGPGPGGLTRALLDTKASHIIAIEKDQRCLPALHDIAALANQRLQVIEGDALKTNYRALINDHPCSIVANLPYNIGTELLLEWLHEIELYRSLTLMFQREVAERISAKPSSKAYGRLSIISQFCCNVQLVMNIPARAFTPAPKVDSAVVHLTPRAERPSDISLQTMEILTAAAFGQRRKMLRSSLRSLGGEILLQQAQIDPTLRAENLSLQDFENLARHLQKANALV